MARTLEQIQDRVRDLAPRFLSGNTIGQALLNGLAGALLEVEQLVDTFAGYVQRDDPATPAAWADELGATRGNTREPWETVEQFGERNIVGARGPTPAHLVDELNRVVQPNGYTVELYEPTLMFCDLEGLDDGLWADDPGGIVYDAADDPLFGLLVRVPFIEVVDADDSFCDLETGDAGALVADDVDDASFVLPLREDFERSPYDRIGATVDRLRPAGSRVRVVYADTVETVHIPLIFRTVPGSIY